MEHRPEVRQLLGKAGLSEHTDLSAWEERHLPAALEALDRNPQIRQSTLLRTLRPPEDRPVRD